MSGQTHRKDVFFIERRDAYLAAGMQMRDAINAAVDDTIEAFVGTGGNREQ